MGDPIDRQAAIDAVAFGITYTKVFDKETGKVKELFAECNYELKNAIDRIKELPSVDAVEVVRCKDCVRWNTIFDRTKAEYGLCQIRSQLEATKNDDFCSRGERRTDDCN